MKIIVISICKSRRSRLEKIFAESHKDFFYINPVKSNRMSAREFFRLTAMQSSANIMTPGEVACMLSHLRSLEYFLTTNEDRCLILEDDIIGCDADILLIKDLSHLISDNSILMCGGQDGLNSRRLLFGKKIGFDNIFQVSKPSTSFLYRTCCYVVTRKSAHTLIEYLKSNLVLADSWSIFSNKLNIKIYFSDILKHPADLNSSNLEEDRYKLRFARAGFLKTLRKLIRIVISLTKNSLYFLIGYKKIF